MAPAILFPLAAEWSTGTTVAVLAYVASVLAVMVVTAWLICRHNPGASAQFGRGGGQLLALASFVWPLWAWFVLPKLWAASERRAMGGRRPAAEVIQADPPHLPGVGERCGRCADRIIAPQAAHPWGTQVLCSRCANDLAVN